MPNERTRLEAADGVTLDGELSVPDGARAAVVLAHPHPRYGGSMRSPLIDGLFGALPAAGVATLRFDFRGVGRSGGEHDGGRAERLDVEAAVDALATAAPGLPVVLAGWSFGADVTLCVTGDLVAGWFAMAAPLSLVPAGDMAAAADPRPKVLAVPEHDQLRSPASAREATATWTATRVQVVAATDHSFAGGAARAAELCLSMLEEVRARR